MNMSREEKYILIGVGIVIGVIAVATAPAWLPAAKARALQTAAIESAKLLTSSIV